ncbi:MAG TPA: hypothetical protein VN667_22505 [Burkholderiales bacterium]|nr:hypothetical protein [Burkholderiales bacterium]
MTLGTIEDIENCMENGWSDGLPGAKQIVDAIERLLDDQMPDNP